MTGSLLLPDLHEDGGDNGKQLGMPGSADQRPWDHADLVARGTPQIPFEPATELVVTQPPARGHPAGQPLFASMEGESRVPIVRLTGNP